MQWGKEGAVNPRKSPAATSNSSSPISAIPLPEMI